MRNQRRRQRGFTLIEMMTVIAIIALITVSLASMSSNSGASTPLLTSDRITGMIQFARLRAEARRTIHQVQVTTTSVSVWEATYAAGKSGFAPTTGFLLVQTMDIPSGVVVFAADPTVQSAGGATPVQNANLPLSINFKPDGQSTGGTVFLTDMSTLSKFRVFIYKTTGTAMSRENW